MDQERLLDRVAHAEARVERLVRILVDDLHLAPQRPQLPVRHARDAPGRGSGSLPESASTIRITVWAVVVLPQPDSPTSASISPAADREVDALDGVHLQLRPRRIIVPTTPRGTG